MARFRLFTLLLFCFSIHDGPFAQTKPEKNLVILYTAKANQLDHIRSLKCQ